MQSAVLIYAKHHLLCYSSILPHSATAARSPDDDRTPNK